MCGIFGYTGHRHAQTVLFEGLRRLEYRGYDSAGIAVAGPDGLKVIRRAGTLDELERALRAAGRLEGSWGLGHTRWATHGRPTEANAHPFVDCTGDLALAHNGIIENHQALRERLKKQGHIFRSETDTEVVVHLIESKYMGRLVDAVASALKEVEGTYAIVAAHRKEPGLLVGARRENPLVLGVGQGEMFFASDVPAIIPYTRRVVFIEDGEVAAITPDRFALWSMDTLEGRQRAMTTVDYDVEAAERAGYKHFMLKEIFEQPRAISDSLLGRLGDAEADALTSGLRPIRRVKIIACGSSAHAGLIGRFILEKVARVPTSVEIASEYKYSESLPEDALIVAVTQSGETIDTLTALKESKRRGSDTIAISNVVGSSITREVGRTVYTRAGPEIGVAASKTLTTQLVALMLLALSIGKRNGHVSPEQMRYYEGELRKLPQSVQAILDQNEAIRQIAKKHERAHDMYFIGRHAQFPVAVEGAHKLKEISYVHAEAYAGGELKHGANALLGPELPVIAVALRDMAAARDVVYSKMLSNIGECTARDSPVVGVGTTGDTELPPLCEDVIFVPRSDPLLSTVPATVALQLFAYHSADLRGCPIDKPRNLAKTVTVE